MKTNVTMISEKDRNLFGVTIRQETQNGFLCLTDLQEAYVHARVENGWKEKGKVQDIIAQKENAERIFFLLKEQKIINSEFSDFINTIEKDGVVKVLKELGVYKTTGRGADKRVMCNPYIWVLVAMELNPMLYAKVVMWLTDKLLLNRIEAGDFYKSLASALYKLPNPNYSGVSVALNKKVFGRHELGIRNKASKEELAELKRLEDNIAFAIEKGWLKTSEDVITAIAS